MDYAHNLAKSKLTGLFQSSNSFYSHKLRTIKVELFPWRLQGGEEAAPQEDPKARISSEGWPPLWSMTM